MAGFPIARRFEKKATELLEEAEARRESVYGIKPWYCSASFIDSGAKIAFIGANPGGGPQSQEDDKRLGILRQPYNDSRYCAWLDDRHWEGDGSLQRRVIEAFEVLFGPRGRDTLRSAACFNVVPLRTGGVADLSQATWEKGIVWTVEVLEHIKPEVIVCNGNGAGRSAWNVFNRRRFVVAELEECTVYGTFRLKSGRIASQRLQGARVIGLPHLARMKSIASLRDAAIRLWGSEGGLVDPKNRIM